MKEVAKTGAKTAKSKATVPNSSKPAVAKRNPTQAKAFKKIAIHESLLPQTKARIFMMDPQTRIDMIKRGVPAAHVGALAADMKVSKEFILDVLRIPRATINRKLREAKPLSPEDSERVLGIEYLIGQVDTMIRESGEPAGFDAAQWVSKWLDTPLLALGGARPAQYMDTIEGQKLVSSLLASAQTGAYV